MVPTSPIVPVILSGGSGTRLWPMSKPERPKQLLALTGEETMLQLTARRTRADAGFAAPIVVASAQHADEVDSQLCGVGADTQALILEPMGRNTAPAIALAALAAGGGATPLLVMPSDHVIADIGAFRTAVAAAMPLVEQGWLVTLGINPETPETGYGWIKVGESVGAGVHRVERFVEKPQRDKAEAMFAAGGHVWNGGIFLFRADRFLDSLAEFAPAMLAATERAMERARREGVRIWPDREAFALSPADSIDYAVLEKAPQVAVVPVSMGWSDVGSWDALHALSERDDEGNVVRGDVVAINIENCLIRSEHGRRVAIVGVSDLIVVVNGADVLVMPRGRSQEVKNLLEVTDRQAVAPIAG